MEYNKYTTYDVGNKCIGLQHAQKCDGVRPVDEIPTLLFCFLVFKGVTVLSSKLPIDRIQAYVHNHIKRYVTCVFIFEIKTLSISNIKKIHRQGFHIILFIGNRRTF